MTELKAVIDKLHQLRAEISDRFTRIRRDRSHAGAPVSAKFSEQAVERENDEVLDRLHATTEADLRQIDHALSRVQAGLYPLCEVCGNRIEMERLRAMPFATTCARCASKNQQRAASK